MSSSAPNDRTPEPGLGALENERRRRGQLAALLTVAHAVSHTLDLQQILRTIVDQLRVVIPADECTVYLYDPSDQTLRPAAMDYDSFVDAMESVRFQLGQGLTGWVARHRRGVLVHDARRDPRVYHIPGTPDDESTMISVPLIARDELLGVITVEGKNPGTFTEEHLELAMLFAGQCSSAMANARLYEEARRALEDLRRAQEQAVRSARLQALGEMAGGVAHGFNNVLAAILGRAQLALHRAGGTAFEDDLRVIERAALDGANTVRRVQSFTRVRQDEDFETLEPRALLAEVLEMTRPAWERAGASSRPVDASVRVDSSRTVVGNAADLREALVNLVLNAADAMPDGGTLELSARDDGEDVLLAVRDTGPGIPDEVRARLFEPFFTTKSTSGTGLGLSVAYGIASRHRGTLEVESRPGAGATFTLRLPARSLPVPAAPAPPASTAESLRALVVDDEDVVLQVLADLLEAMGVRVVRALGGAAGVAALEANEFDVVFTDLGMPGVTGWDVAAAVRARSEDTRVVLVTGWGHQIDEDEAHGRGVDRVLSKPFAWDDVERSLGTVRAAA